MRKIQVKRKKVADPFEDVREKLKRELRAEVEEEFREEFKALHQRVFDLQAAVEVKEQRLTASQSVIESLQKTVAAKDGVYDTLTNRLERWNKTFPFTVDVAAEFLEDLCKLADAGDIELFKVLRDYGIRVKTRKRKNG